MTTTTTTTVGTPDCRWCNGLHLGACPRVKAIQYHKDGTVERVEFFSPAELAPRAPSYPMPVYPVPGFPLPPYPAPDFPTDDGGLKVTCEWRAG